jgi:lipopolysaccharide assembly outer membrane protein LptD (OstA)
VETPGKEGLAWRLQGSAPGLGVSGEELKSAVLKDVKGELMRKGKTVSRVEGAEARVDHVRRRLVLAGGVQVASLDQGLTLRADRIEYSDGGQFIEARGGVTLTGKGYRLGPSSALRATPDLRRVGTEDRVR